MSTRRSRTNYDIGATNQKMIVVEILVQTFSDDHIGPDQRHEVQLDRQDFGLIR